ncbi:MAG TPA: TPM domain-containing protein [Thermoanaerobaculia bacterium]|nr:TPM domain-containing protein [Thermoanaerobaculia bacterium]
MIRVVAAAAAIALSAGCAAPAPPADEPAAPLGDRAGVLAPRQRERIVDYLRFVEQRYGVDYRVVVESPPGTAEVGAHAAELFRRLDIGSAHRGRGLLLWIDPATESVRVEVGYALEPYLTDLAASRMLREYLEPRWLATDPAIAIEAAVEALVEAITPQLAALAAEEAEGAGSGGAGAAADLLRQPPAEPVEAGDFEQLLVPQTDPRTARDLELTMLHRGLYLQGSRLYDAEWRRAHRPRSWPCERLQEIARDWDRPYEIVSERGRAVAYYPDAPALGPTFLRRDEEGWVIDATATARLIVYDYSNERWYAVDEPSPYVTLLGRALELRRVRLGDGRAAWMLDRR